MNFFLQYIKYFLIFTTASLIFSQALANHNEFSHKKFRYYTGVSIGSTGVDTGLSNPTGDSTIDTPVVTFRAFLGVMVTKWLAVEAYYADLGRVSARLDSNSQVTYRSNVVLTDVLNRGTINITTSSAGIGPVISYDLPAARPFVRFGVQRWNYSIKDQNISPSLASQSKNGVSMYYGAGIDFKLSRDFWLRTDFVHYLIESTSASQFNLGLMYIF